MERTEPMVSMFVLFLKAVLSHFLLTQDKCSTVLLEGGFDGIPFGCPFPVISLIVGGFSFCRVEQELSDMILLK